MTWRLIQITFNLLLVPGRVILALSVWALGTGCAPPTAADKRAFREYVGAGIWA